MVVVLLNTAFQDGSPEHSRAWIFRYAQFAAALVLVPLVTLAAYAVWLRVAQYGWTVERVVTAATVLIALCYAFGYAAAAFALARRRRMDAAGGAGQCRDRLRDRRRAASAVHALGRSVASGGGEPGDAPEKRHGDRDRLRLQLSEIRRRPLRP
ncbi:MAG: DUF4153 domain-containing protein [Rhizomicrobium sp.]